MKMRTYLIGVDGRKRIKMKMMTKNIAGACVGRGLDKLRASEPASHVSRASGSCESSCEREPCETNVSSSLSMCCITKMPRNSFIIPFSPSQMTLHLDPDLTQEQRLSVGIP